MINSTMQSRSKFELNKKGSSGYLNGINGLNVLSGPQLQTENESQLVSPKGLIPKIHKTRFSSIGTEIEL